MAYAFYLLSRLKPNWVLDRFEENMGVLISADTKEPMVVPKKNLPKEAKAGDTLINYKERWYIDIEDSKNREKLVHARYSRMVKA